MNRAAALALLMTTFGCGETTLPDDIEVISVQTGARASFEAMIDDLVQARAIYVGEQHDQEAHHALQAAIVRAIHARDPSLAVGVEMVQRPFQQAVDDYVAGRIDEDELLERIEWRSRWGFDFAMYRPIFEHARAHQIPVVAANAPKEITRAIGRGGLDALDPADRASLAELDLRDERHRAMVHEALAGHGGMDEAMLERFYTAQVVWDETMAEAVAETLAAEGGPRRIVVLAGDMHVRGGLGIPQRAARRGATPYRIVLPVAPDEDLRAEPRAADWLVRLPTRD